MSANLKLKMTIKLKLRSKVSFYKNFDIIIRELNWLNRDILLLGSLLYEMITLDNPWKTANYPIELGNEVFINKEPPIPAHYSPFLKNLVRMCLNISK